MMGGTAAMMGSTVTHPPTACVPTLIRRQALPVIPQGTGQAATAAAAAAVAAAGRPQVRMGRSLARLHRGRHAQPCARRGRGRELLLWLQVQPHRQLQHRGGIQGLAA